MAHRHERLGWHKSRSAAHRAPNESDLGGTRNGGSARGYLRLARPLSSPRMAYWIIARSVYLYIAILGANVRFCRIGGVFKSVAGCSPRL